jgi:hypothetical protein
MFLWMIFVAAVLGVGRMNVGLGILLALLSLPALVRTAATAVRRSAGGGGLSPGEKTRLFLATLTLIVIVSVAACAAFLSVCLGAVFASGAREETGYGVALLIGGLVGLILAIAVAWLILRRWWSRSGQIALKEPPKE